MRHINRAFLIIFIVSCGCGIAFREKAGPGPSICWMGDSRIEWFQNEKYFENHQWNIGYRGYTSEKILLQIPEVQTMNPDIVVISIGINDEALYNYAGFIGNMDFVIQSLKPYTTRLIITNVVPNAYYNANRQAINEQLKNLCDSRAVQFVDLVGMESSDGIINMFYTYDGCHYNEAGQAEFAALIKAAL
jgi:lysophospholipase L1-like esterase